MEIQTTTLADVYLINLPVFEDERGHFFESFNAERWRKAGFSKDFVQDNQSFSRKGVIRGLHFQNGEHAQGKLVRVIKGHVRDIALDLRPESPTFGKYEFFELKEDTPTMVYIPEGFAHGFVALQDSIFQYKCTALYCKEAESGIRWNDPALMIPWEIESPIVSEKDSLLPTFEYFVQSLDMQLNNTLD